MMATEQQLSSAADDERGLDASVEGHEKTVCIATFSFGNCEVWPLCNLLLGGVARKYVQGLDHRTNNISSDWGFVATIIPTESCWLL
jgi:hypothetical protein